MGNPAREQRLLELAVDHGLLSAADVGVGVDSAPAEATPEERTLDPHEQRFGPRAAQLIAAGRLSAEDLTRLAELLVVREPPQSAEPSDGTPGSASSPPSIPSKDPVEQESRPDEPLPSFLKQRWERYEFLRLLGSGGMGIVYAARDRKLGRQVALKFLLGAGELQTRRFLQEARAQARVRHAGICEVYEVGEVEGRSYIAMQLLEGQPLNLVYGAMSLAEKIQVIIDIAEALHAAHSQGIIHRALYSATNVVEKLEVAQTLE